MDILGMYLYELMFEVLFYDLIFGRTIAILYNLNLV